MTIAIPATSVSSSLVSMTEKAASLKISNSLSLISVEIAKASPDSKRKNALSLINRERAKLKENCFSTNLTTLF